MANQINSRIINKHDTEVNWNKAENFIFCRKIKYSTGFFSEDEVQCD